MSSPAKPLEPLLTPKQVSEYIGVPVNTLAIWRCTGRVNLPYVKIGRAVRYRREDVERFIANGGARAQAPGVKHEPAAVTVQMFDLRPCEGCSLSFASSALVRHGGSRLLCPNCHRKVHWASVHHVRRPTSLPLRTPKIADRPYASEEAPQRRKPRRAP